MAQLKNTRLYRLEFTLDEWYELPSMMRMGLTQSSSFYKLQDDKFYFFIDKVTWRGIAPNVPSYVDIQDCTEKDY